MGNKKIGVFSPNAFINYLHIFTLIEQLSIEQLSHYHTFTP